MLRIALLSMLVVCPITLAQVSTEEATARLRAKQASRTTQPATRTSDDVERLRQVIADLQRQIAYLRAENRTLRQQANKLKATAVPSDTTKSSHPDDDGPGLYRIPYYVGGDVSGESSEKLNFDVLANSRAAAIKIALAQGLHVDKRLDRDGNVLVVCTKIREMTPQEKSQ